MGPKDGERALAWVLYAGTTPGSGFFVAHISQDVEGHVFKTFATRDEATRYADRANKAYRSLFDD